MKKVIAVILTLLVILLIVYLPYQVGLVANRGFADVPICTWACGLLNIIGGIFVLAGACIVLFIIVLLVCGIYVIILDLIGG